MFAGANVAVTDVAASIVSVQLGAGARAAGAAPAGEDLPVVRLGRRASTAVFSATLATQVLGQSMPRPRRAAAGDVDGELRRSTAAARAPGGADLPVPVHLDGARNGLCRCMAAPAQEDVARCRASGRRSESSRSRTTHVQCGAAAGRSRSRSRAGLRRGDVRPRSPRGSDSVVGVGDRQRALRRASLRVEVGA